MVSHGHRLSEIEQYTMYQIDVFCEAIVSEMKQDILRNTNIAFYGSRAEGKDLNKFMKKFTSNDSTIKEDPKVVAAREKLFDWG